MNERVDDMLWIIEKCMGEHVMMEVGDIQMKLTEVAGVRFDLRPGYFPVEGLEGILYHRVCGQWPCPTVSSMMSRWLCVMPRLYSDDDLLQ